MADIDINTEFILSVVCPHCGHDNGTDQGAFRMSENTRGRLSVAV
jgi:hypothetical protein